MGSAMLTAVRLEDCRRAIRDGNGRLRALVHVLPEPLHGEGASLAGVPYTLKDTWDTPGIPTTGGSWRHRARVPTEAAPVYEARAVVCRHWDPKLFTRPPPAGC